MKLTKLIAAQPPATAHTQNHPHSPRWRPRSDPSLPHANLHRQSRTAWESVVYVWQAVLAAPATSGFQADVLPTPSTARNWTTYVPLLRNCTLEPVNVEP